MVEGEKKLKQKTKIQLVSLNEDSVSNYRFLHKEDSLILLWHCFYEFSNKKSLESQIFYLYLPFPFIVFLFHSCDSRSFTVYVFDYCEMLKVSNNRWIISFHKGEKHCYSIIYSQKRNFTCFSFTLTVLSCRIHFKWTALLQKFIFLTMQSEMKEKFQCIQVNNSQPT